MRIIFMGTPDFAAKILQALIQAGHDIVLTLTQPDRPKGRHGAAQKSEVRKLSEDYGIPVLTPERLKSDEAAKEAMRSSGADVAVVAAFGQLLPEDVLAIPKHGCINVHASLLPKYRGASPIQWAVLNGDGVSGVTTMQMDKGMDTGDILEQLIVPLDDKETGGSLFEKLSSSGAELILHTLQSLSEGKLEPKPQDDSLASKVGLIKKEDGHINWDDSAIRIERMVRGMNPWPSAYTFIHGKQVKIWEAGVLEKEELPKGASFALFLNGDGKMADRQGKQEGKPEERPGSIWISGERIFVFCGTGLLEILSLQMESKKRMKADDFLRGNMAFLKGNGQ